jgi:hypothetical protein
MTSLRRFSLSFAPLLLAGACAQIIGLSDYETGPEPNGSDGGQGNEGPGGTSSGAKGGVEQGGDAGGGTAGVLGQGGRGGSGGSGGTAAGMAGEGGEGGMETGGTTGGGGRGGGAGGGQGGRGGMGGSGGSGGSGAVSGAGGSPPCTEVTAMTLVDQVIDRDGQPHAVSYGFRINPGIGLASTDDLLEVQFWNGDDFDGILTGMFPLDAQRDSNNSTCSRCLLGYQDKDASAGLSKVFFQTEGTLTIDASSQQMDGFPNFTYSDVTLREVTIDPNDGHSTLVAGGACLHFASGSFSLPPQWNCNPAWVNDGDCDCGCATKDPDCTSDDASVCEFCWCDDAEECPDFESPTKNWMCL